MDRRKWISRVAIGSAGLVMYPHSGTLMPEVDIEEKYLRLNANENPYGCSEEVLKVFYSSGKEVNRYAFASVPGLKKAVANRFGVDKNQVLLGAGSSGLLEAIGHFMLHKEVEVTTAKPTFDILPAMLAKFQRKTHYVPLKTDHSLDLKGLLDKTREHPGLVYIVNPNNPIGTTVPSQELRQFIEAASQFSYVVVDEAYIEFCDKGESMIDMIVNPKVMVIKTFSKAYGLAGLRIGYGFAHKDLANELEKYMIYAGLPISSPAFPAVAAALDDQGFIDFVVKKNTESKAIVETTLHGLGIDYIPSQTSFILFDISKYQGDFGSDMKNQGILIGIRNYLGKTWCRVSMGTVKETKEFTNVLLKLWKT